MWTVIEPIPCWSSFKASLLFSVYGACVLLLIAANLLTLQGYNFDNCSLLFSSQPLLAPTFFANSFNQRHFLGTDAQQAVSERRRESSPMQISLMYTISLDKPHPKLHASISITHCWSDWPTSLEFITPKFCFYHGDHQSPDLSIRKMNWI